VVRWEARQGKELLDELFAMDPGARRLGEFAIGTNNAVPTFTKNVLFDEKIGGTCHLAVGASIPITGGQVQSSLHWDMICDLRRGGAIYADGDLIHENGEWKI
jgi:aminopeptidase